MSRRNLIMPKESVPKGRHPDKFGASRQFGILLCGVVTVFCSAAAAQTAEKQAQLKLIPAPKQVQQTEGTFTVTAQTAVLLADSTNAEDRFAAEQLIEEIAADLGIKLQIGGSVNSEQMILIGQIGQGEAIEKAVREAQISLPEQLGREGYVLSVAPTQILVAGRDSEGTFYGVQTLRQIIRGSAEGNSIPCCRIADWPTLEYRGWQDDISRGPIPTLEYLKRQIRTLSEYKLNQFTMYTEHVFKLNKHPKIAPADGITAEEVKELVEYAKKYHVEITGNFQSFGHFGHILQVPEYSHLGEKKWVLTPAREESYAFLKDVYSEIAPAYQSRYFNINCDETWGLGEGASKQMVKQMGIGGVYAYHISRINELLKPYSKIPMMWGDIALEHRDIVPKLPADLIVLSWGYDPRPSFDNKIVPFVEMGLKFIVCPGVNCWRRIWPDFDAAVVNVSNYVRDGDHYRTLGMLNTTWDDDGENLFGYNWLPLVWGAECAWQPVQLKEGQDPNAVRANRFAIFSRNYDAIFYGCSGDSITRALLGISNLRRYTTSDNLFNHSFWKDSFARVVNIPLPDADKDPAGMFKEADRIIDSLQKARVDVRYNADSIDFAVFAARRIRFIAQRKLICNAIARKAAVSEKDLSAGRSADWDKQVEADIGKLRDELVWLKTEYQRLWRLENRPWWLDKNLQCYDKLLEKLSKDRILSKLSKPVLLRPARIVTTMQHNEDNVPELAFDGDAEDSFFWSDKHAKKDDAFTLILDEPAVFGAVRALSSHERFYQSGYVHHGVLEISADGNNFQKVADFEEGVAEAKLSVQPIKAVRIRLTDDQKKRLIIREIILQ